MEWSLGAGVGWKGWGIRISVPSVVASGQTSPQQLEALRGKQSLGILKGDREGALVEPVHVVHGVGMHRLAAARVHASWTRMLSLNPTTVGLDRVYIWSRRNAEAEDATERGQERRK